MSQPVEFPAGWEVPQHSEFANVSGPPTLAACSMSTTEDHGLRSRRWLSLGIPKWHRDARQEIWEKVLLEAIDLGARDVRVGLFSGQHKLVYVTRSKRVTRKALSETDRRKLLEWALSICGISDYGILTAGESVRTAQHVGRFRIEFSLQVYPPASRHVLRLAIIDISQSSSRP